MEWLIHRAENLNRFAKYLVLFVMLGVMTLVVFNAFSYYVARRDLEGEMKAKNISSLEILLLDARKKRALALASLETRCTERTQLAAFRLLQSPDAEAISKAYDDLYDAKLKILTLLTQKPGIVRDDGDFINALNSADFDIGDLSRRVVPAFGIADQDPAFVALAAGLRDAIASYETTRANLKSASTLLLENKQFNALLYQNLGIAALEDRTKRLKIQLQVYNTPAETDEAAKTKAENEREILSRIAIWTEALTGGQAANPILDELTFDANVHKDEALRNLDCRALEQYFRTATGIDLRLEPESNGAWASIVGVPSSIARWYRNWLIEFFNLPQVAQTLLVTLFMGALGALGLNVLRLSKVGWWEAYPDPRWGEVLLSPFLGSLAALAVFLLASTGVLLTSGGGPQDAPLSAFFIGLLGLLSGLLYDEAFGQVRRVGSRYFGEETAPGSRPSEADTELANILAAQKIPLAARMSLLAHLGDRLARDAQFTLFVPPDAFVPRGLLEATVKAQFGVKTPDVDNWFEAHVSDQRLAESELKQLASTATDVTMRDGSRRQVTLAGAVVSVGKAPVAKADIGWKKGIVHILGADFS